MAQFNPTTKRPKGGTNAAGGRRADLSWIGSIVGAAAGDGAANSGLTPAATNYLGGGYTGDIPVYTDNAGIAAGGDINTPQNITPAQTQLYSKQFNPSADNMYNQPTTWQRLTNPRGAAATDAANAGAKQQFAMQGAADQVNEAKALADVKAVNAHNSPFDDPDEEDYAARLIVKQVGANNINKLGAQGAIDNYLQGQSTLANSRAQTPGIEATSRELQNRADIGSATKDSDIRSKLAQNDYQIGDVTAKGTEIPSRTEANINENTLRGIKAQSGVVLNPAQTSLESAKIDAAQREMPSAVARSIYNNTNIPVGGEGATPYTLQLNPSGGGGVLNQTPGAINRADPMGIMGSSKIPSGTVFANGRAFAPKAITPAPVTTPSNNLVPAATSLGGPKTSGVIPSTPGGDTSVSDEDYYKQYLEEQARKLRGGIPQNLVIPNY